VPANKADAVPCEGLPLRRGRAQDAYEAGFGTKPAARKGPPWQAGGRKRGKDAPFSAPEPADSPGYPRSGPSRGDALSFRPFYLGAPRKGTPGDLRALSRTTHHTAASPHSSLAPPLPPAEAAAPV